MEGLRPPLVGRYSEPWDAGGVVRELLDLFWKGEEGDEGLSSGSDGEGGIAEGIGTVVGWLAWEPDGWICCQSDWFGDGGEEFQEF